MEITRIASRDAYNWGYDPVHYGVPEGSYATDPDSPARVLEYRQMVQVRNPTHAIHHRALRHRQPCRIRACLVHRLQAKSNFHVMCHTSLCEAFLIPCELRM